MSTKRLLAAAAVATTIALAATGCSTAVSAEPDTAADGVVALNVGSMFPATEILQYVIDTQADEANLEIEITEFSEYVTPNASLEDGSLDANLYQHRPFLDNFNTEHGSHLVAVGEVYFPALALYSKTLDSVDEIPNGSTISIPADPTNQLRSLELLEKAELITLKDGAAGVADIDENPKKLQFQELDAATLPRALEDVDAGIVNLVYALPAGLTGKDQIFQEDIDGTPYTNLLAVKDGNETNPGIKKLYELLTSAETQKFIDTEFNGLVIPAGGSAE
ncbi:MAG: transporter substrate-binding protein [Microbacteriaceae bacterium]|nr:transporter substrate-binding protein [Microbacteriaceae bacterium]HEV7955847.1 MetQ/NlpA family ABC transporter substrate-binding protein [Marisediminicola sp.]